jgi:hypothetical protein
MRLINVNTLELHTRTTEPHAILSHTWGDDEVTFEEYGTESAKRKAGYQKILQACIQAKKDGSQFLWIDTCLIDKRSSAELSESINSMFKWYQESEICYIFLEDVDDATEMAGAKWFTRGWTLQELLASPNAIFFNRAWQPLGSKADSEMVASVSSITGIDANALGAVESLDYIRATSIATRMRWASKRKTTREEDIAYCLFGLFDVNMPLIYGEGGEKAFLRLQEEIMKQSTDHSILAWEPHSWFLGYEGYLCPVCPVLAPNPTFFANCRRILPTEMQVDPFSLNNKGLQIRIPIYQRENSRNRFVAVLACFDSFEDGLNGHFGVPVRSLQRDNKVFVREDRSTERVGAHDLRRARIKDICLLKTVPIPKSPILWAKDVQLACDFKIVDYVASTGHWHPFDHTIEVSVGSEESRYFGIILKSDADINDPAVLVIVHFKPWTRYTANISIHKLEGGQDLPSVSMAGVLGQTSQGAEATTRFTALIDRKSPKPHTVRILASILWNRDAGRDVLALHIQMTNSSLVASIRRSFLTWSTIAYGISKISAIIFWVVAGALSFVLTRSIIIVFDHQVRYTLYSVVYSFLLIFTKAYYPATSLSYSIYQPLGTIPFYDFQQIHPGTVPVGLAEPNVTFNTAIPKVWA